MPENPYVSSASGAAGAASSNFGAALRYVTALREAADQQQKLQQAQDLEHRKEVMNLQKEGYQPAEINTGGTIAKGGLGHRAPNPAAQGPGINVTDTRGAKWFKSQTTPQQTFQDLREALNQHGQVLDEQGNTFYDPNTGAGVAPPPGRVAQIPGGPRVYFPTDEAIASDKERERRTERQAEESEKNYTLPDAVTSRLESQAKLPEGTLKGLALPRSEVREILTGLAGKTQLPHIVTRENDAGDVTTVAYDQETGDQKWSRTLKGVGLKHKDPDAAPGQRPATPSQLNAIRRRYKADLAHAKRVRDLAIKQATYGDYRDADEVRAANDQYRADLQEAHEGLVQDLGEFGRTPEDSGYAREDVPSIAPGAPPKAPLPEGINTPATGLMALLARAAGSLPRRAPAAVPPQRAEQTQGQGPVQAGGPQQGPPSKSASPVTKQAPAQPQVQEGTVVRNKAGVRLVLRGGQWQPLTSQGEHRPQYNPGPATRGQQTQQPAGKTASLDQVRAYAEKNGITLSEAIRQAKSEGFQINSAPRGQQGQGSGSQTRYRYYANDNGRLRGSNDGKSWTDIGRGKLTDPDTARRYLDQAGGDKNKARQMAKADGWEF
jgi:hypothetical protein